MDDLFLLSERQMARLSPHFPLSHGVPRVDDRRVVSGSIIAPARRCIFAPALTGERCRPI